MGRTDGTAHDRRTLPLALLTNEAEGDIDSAFAQFQQRLQNERVGDNVKQDLSEAAGWLLELRFPADIVWKLGEGARMKTEDTIMYRVMAGQELRQSILRQGTKIHGIPGAAIESALKAITDLERMRRILDRVHEAVS